MDGQFIHEKRLQVTSHQTCHSDDPSQKKKVAVRQATRANGNKDIKSKRKKSTATEDELLAPSFI